MGIGSQPAALCFTNVYGGRQPDWVRPFFGNDPCQGSTRSRKRNAEPPLELYLTDGCRREPRHTRSPTHGLARPQPHPRRSRPLPPLPLQPLRLDQGLLRPSLPPPERHHCRPGATRRSRQRSPSGRCSQRDRRAQPRHRQDEQVVNPGQRLPAPAGPSRRAARHARPGEATVPPDNTAPAPRPARPDALATPAPLRQRDATPNSATPPRPPCPHRRNQG